MTELALARQELILPELNIVRFVVDRAIEPLGLRTERVFKKLRDGLVFMAGFSDGVENKVLDWMYRGVAMTPASPRFLALTTSAVNETNTSANITEANYTGYGRLSLADAVFGAASSGEVHNTAQQTFAPCTASTSTVIGWAMCSVVTTAGAGDVYHFGTCTSTVISTTQTPATINASALSLSLD